MIWQIMKRANNSVKLKGAHFDYFFSLFSEKQHVHFVSFSTCGKNDDEMNGRCLCDDLKSVITDKNGFLMYPFDSIK